MYIQYTKLFQESIQFYKFKITVSQRIEKICMFNVYNFLMKIFLSF